MSFTFTPKQATTTPGFSFGTPSGDNKAVGAAKPAPAAQPNFGFGGGGAAGAAPSFTGLTNKLTATTPAPTFNLGTPAASTAASTTPALSFGLGNTTAAPTFNISAATSTPAATSTGFSLGALSTPATTSVAPPSTGFSLGSTPAPATTPATSFGPQAKIGVAAATTAAPALNFNAASTAAAPAPTFSLGGTTTTAVATVATTPSSLGTFSLAGATAAKPTLSFGAATSAASSLGATPATTSVLSTTSTTSAIPATSTLTFAQLEDAINKWTINLEDQGKLFANQAKQLNAWDRLLISNGEKVLSLNSGIERVKQQQQQLDQELDFVLAQQKELEDLIAPLEKDLQELPTTDVDRHHTYQLAENLDTQLKQMSEDLKEIIEQLNESHKTQEKTNPISQIGKILNAHMNSLQWIDRNTTKITTHLDQISKMQDIHRRQNEKTLMSTYE